MNKTGSVVHIVLSLAIIPNFALGQDVFDAGVAAFRKGDYSRALDLLHQAETLHPDQAEIHAYLGTTYFEIAGWSAALTMVLKDPARAAQLSEADRAAAAKMMPVADAERMADIELRRALALDPNNQLALLSLVNLAHLDNADLPAPEKAARLAESRTLYDRLTIAEADDSLRKLAEALDSLRPSYAKDTTGNIDVQMGELIASEWRQVVQRASGSPLNSVGPLPNPMRQTLQAKYSAVINEGMAHFERALQINPNNNHAMMGMADLIRDRAVLRDTKEEFAADVAVADTWSKRGFDTRDGPAQRITVAPPPQISSQPPTRIREGEQPSATGQRIGMLIRKVTPSYPPAAIQAHVTGTVRFAITIGRDGRPAASRPISGNPMLFEAAQNALKQWLWQPTAVNGKLVEVDTEVEVRFSDGK